MNNPVKGYLFLINPVWLLIHFRFNITTCRFEQLDWYANTCSVASGERTYLWMPPIVSTFSGGHNYKFCNCVRCSRQAILASKSGCLPNAPRGFPKEALILSQWVNPRFCKICPFSEDQGPSSRCPKIIKKGLSGRSSWGDSDECQVWELASCKTAARKLAIIRGRRE
jgi:hypothetical protein